MSKVIIDLKSYWLVVKGFLGEFTEAILLFLAFVVAGYALKVIFSRLEARFSRDKERFGWYSLFSALAAPVFILFIFWGFIVAVDGISLPFRVKDFFPVFKKAGLVIFFVWISMSYINSYEERYFKVKNTGLNKVNKTTLNIVMKFSNAVIIIISILAVMDIFGLDIRGLLAVATLCGAAIALAAKDILASFLGTIILYVDKPFAIGDFVQLSDGRAGNIEYIGWRVTQVRTLAKTVLYISNATFANMVVENLTRRSHWFIKQRVGIRYEDIAKLPKITKDIKKMLCTHPDVDSEEHIWVAFIDYDNTVVNFNVCAPVNAPDRVVFFDIRQDIMLKVDKIIKSNKAKLVSSVKTVELTDSKGL